MAKVFVITGPSGVGKGTLIRELLRARARPRALGLGDDAGAARGRGDGRDYHFLTPEEFERRIDEKDFLEFATYSGNRYGTLRSEVERCLDARPLGRARDRGPGRPAGAGGETRLGSDLHRPARPRGPARTALVGRGTDSTEAIDERLKVAEQELAAQDDFDHRIVNDDIDRAAAELAGIVRAELGRGPGGLIL